MLPKKTTEPEPIQNTTVPINHLFKLRWTAGEGATEHHVYINNRFIAVKNMPDCEYTFTATSEYDMRYIWRIDAVNEFGTTKGDDWEFWTQRPERKYNYYLWSIITNDLNFAKGKLGVTQVKRAETGKIASVTTPACLTWIDFRQPYIASGGKVLYIKAVLTVFCLASPKANTVDAIDEALGIASNVIDYLSGKTIGNTTYILSEDNPMEIVESSSTSAVVAVNFDFEIPLIEVNP